MSFESPLTYKIYGPALHNSSFFKYFSVKHFFETFLCRCKDANGGKTIKGDSCCFAHKSAFEEMIKSDETEIVYADYGNQMFKNPFTIVLDHDTKAIVIAIRGTLSFKDVATDLHGHEAHIPNMDARFKVKTIFFLIN